MRRLVYIAMTVLLIGALAGCSNEQSDRAPGSTEAVAKSQPSGPSRAQPSGPSRTNGDPTEQPAERSTDPAEQPAAIMPGPARTELIPVGEAAPDFSAKDHKGQNVTLSGLLKTQQVVLVFYPADFTSGCTKQLCAVRDDWSEFQKRGAIVLGVNPADVEKHASFAEKYEFPFPVLSDEGGRIAAAYGCLGKEYTKRAVYAINRDGTIALAEGGMVPHEKIFAALDDK